MLETDRSDEELGFELFITKITKIKAFNATLADAVAEKAGSESAVGVIKVLPAAASEDAVVPEAMVVDAPVEAAPVVVNADQGEP